MRTLFPYTCTYPELMRPNEEPATPTARLSQIRLYAQWVLNTAW
jgi:hypothetical protein